MKPALPKRSKRRSRIRTAARPAVRPRKRGGGATPVVLGLAVLLAAGLTFYLWDSASQVDSKVSRERPEIDASANEASVAAELDLAAERALWAQREAVEAKAGGDGIGGDGAGVEEAAQRLVTVAEEDSGTAARRIELEPVAPIFSRELALLAPGANTVDNQNLWQEAMDTALATGQWSPYVEFLRRALDQSLERMALRQFEDRIRTLQREPAFLRAMDVESLLAQLPEDYLARAAGDSTREPFLVWLLRDHPTALSELLAALTGYEDVGAVLDLWAGLWFAEEDESLRERYRALALACALVYSGEGEGSGGGGYGGGSSNPGKASHRYRMFRDNSQAGRLTGNIHRMRAGDLIWVVDIDISDEEVEWALRRMRLTQRRWGEAFNQIEYLMERAVNGVNPYEEYTFAEILKHGGTCGDQSYFCANTAKAHGIPAAIVVGDGDRGGHAWVYWMPDERSWAETGNIGYRTGATRNPQTGQRHTQAMFEMESDRRTGRDRIDQTRQYLRFATLFEKMEREDWALEAVRMATRHTPGYYLPWQALVALMEGDEETALSDWESLASTLRRRFRDVPDFLALVERIEDDHIYPHRDASTNAREIARERRRQARADDRRTDVIVESIERQARILFEAGDESGIRSLYRSAFRDHGTRADAFRELAEQYFAITSGNEEWRERSAAEIERAFQRHLESSDNEYFRATQEIAIMRQIARYHDQADNSSRGDTLRRRAERRERSVRRSAL